MRNHVLLLAWGVFMSRTGIVVQAVRNLRIVSPLQALTIWDKDPIMVEPLVNSTARSRFLPKLKAGLDAEKKVLDRLARKRLQQLQLEASAGATPSSSATTNNKEWATQAARAESRARDEEERMLEAAFDRAVAPFKHKEEATRKALEARRGKDAYQFVGVVETQTSGKQPITWYARKKPANSHWMVRLLHVNRDAILKDLYDRGEIDIFARYDNTGEINPETKAPIIRSNYIVRQRSWKNLWNFSPVHLFTDSSGMYWRERRLRPGLYSDGATVYESTYRYRDGRNGMHRRSTLAQLLGRKSIPDKVKQRTLEKLKKDAPDVVLEE